ncbi:hypothetical protein AK830_g284 [Neonectria ditissima]|uniref:Zn(2)-C6 fungal-type domain-containing protein n=1 Tax=Neonectria ditissima TaxID=78410 RepID=A0A0N8H935_9HYPO|nr:hypothetical protein AK830_g284 [Neonectria ditissima]
MQSLSVSHNRPLAIRQPLGPYLLPGPPPVPSNGARVAAVATVPISTACLACRDKHLKCDGQRPCSRCTSLNCECVYVASRRGYKGPRRAPGSNPKKRKAVAAPSSASLGPDTSLIAFNPSVVYSVSGPASPFILQPPPLPFDPLNLPFYPTVVNPLEALNPPFTPICRQMLPPRDRYMDSFYHHFYSTHPFVLPQDYLLPLTKHNPIEPLIAAMRWVGSLYIETGSTCLRLFEEAYRLIYDLTSPKDGFLVQAMLVLIIGLDGNRQRDKVKEILANVQHLSIQIGLNTRLFASLNGRGIPVLEESWRRIWWDLYVVDATIAGVHRTSNFLLYDVPADVALPCEEYQYRCGQIPLPHYLEEMDSSHFNGNREFSSFAYRIQCARNLGKLMRLPISRAKDKNMVVIETLLTNWQLHLPASKRQTLYKDGELDEMMFQAFMMAYAISILLHQPFSQLDTSPTRYINACAPNTPALSRDAFNSHTKQTINAANEITNLITHRVPQLSHTHFFSYMVTLASTIHLSVWTLAFVPHNDDAVRQKIRLNVGALENFSRVWPAAAHLCGQVKGIAQEVYRIKKQQYLPPQFWVGFTDEAVTVDDSIISEIEVSNGMPTAMDRVAC